jgi:TetR/AcrR family transcriptional regulator, regulator of autoinduction and epiphytic fitness
MSVTELSLKDRQRQMRENAILESANRLLAEKGYQGMTMEELATRVGIAKGSLYQHFKSKEELISAALVSFMDQISNYIDTLPSTQPAIERIKLTCRRALILRFQDGFPDILGVRSLVKESLPCHPVYVASSERLVVAMAGLFDIAKKQGDVASDIPTELLVHATIGRMREPEVDPLIAEGRLQPESVVDFLVQMFLGGVVTDWQRSKMRRAPRV